MAREMIQTAPPADCFNFANAALRVLSVGGYLHTLDDPIKSDWQTINFVPRHSDSDETDAFEVTDATLRTRIPFSSAKPQDGESYLWMRVYEERPLLASESFSSWQMLWVLITPFTGFFNRSHQELNLTWLSETASNAAPPILLHGGVRMPGNYSICRSYKVLVPPNASTVSTGGREVTVNSPFSLDDPSCLFEWLQAIARGADLSLGVEELIPNYHILFHPEGKLGEKVIVSARRH